MTDGDILPANAATAFATAAERALASGDPDRISDDELARVLTAAVKLYAAKVDVDGESVPPLEAEKTTPTEIVVTVTAMIRAVGLNLWDLSMWVQRPQR